MDALLFLATLFLPLLCGLFFSLACFRTPLKDIGATEFGYGLLLGVLLATLLLRALDGVGLAWTRTVLIVGTMLLGLIALWCYRRWVVARESARRPRGRLSPAAGFLFLLLLAMTLMHVGLAFTDAVMRPLFPWDATMHWATKARVWFAEGSLAPFVDGAAWLEAEGAQGIYTDHHPDYPRTVPLLQVWMALARGAWSETAINAPWPILMMALGFIFHGAGRDFGATPLTAMAFTYLLLSLPMVGIHATLAGYGDLPLGIVYLATLLALLRWDESGDRRQLLLAGFLAVMCTLTKNEGLFWALTLLPMLVFLRLPLRAALALTFTGLAGLVVLLLVLPRDLTVAGHSLDSLDLVYREGALPAIGRQFTAIGAWHLLPLVVGAAIAGFCCGAWRVRSLRALAAALGSALLLYLVLFTCTRFAYGAIRLTAVTRIGLHLVPALLCFSMLVWCYWSHRLRPRRDRSDPGDVPAPA